MTLIEMAKEAGFTEGELAWHDHILERFAALVAEKEREACAKVCEEVERKSIKQPPMVGQGCQACAVAIRARGQKEYRGARLVLTKDGVIQDGWMGDK